MRRRGEVGDPRASGGSTKDDRFLRAPNERVCTVQAPATDKGISP
jgi:hypothetical protein